MPKLLFACVVLALLFCLLCGPVLYVALRFWRRGDLAALRPLRVIWLGQGLLAGILIFVADGLDLSRPLAWFMAIICGVSLATTLLYALWRLLRRQADATKSKQ